MCTVLLRGLGLAVCFLCGAVRLRTACRGGMCGHSLYWSLCATLYAGVHALRRVCVRYGVRLEQPEQYSLYVYACMHDGRHVQPERCIRVCVYVRLSECEARALYHSS